MDTYVALRDDSRANKLQAPLVEKDELSEEDKKAREKHAELLGVGEDDEEGAG